MKRTFVLTLIVAVAIALSACAKNENANTATTDTTVTTDTATATHPASPGGTALVPETQAGTTVLVSIDDNRIAVTNADAIPPGPAVFTVTNAGKNVHNLFVEGPGVSQAAGNDISPGSTATMAVTLQPGTYQLYCPLLDHKTRGESLQLIIKPASAPAPTSTAIPASGTETVSTRGGATATGTH